MNICVIVRLVAIFRSSFLLEKLKSEFYQMKNIFLITGLLFLTACSTMQPPRYSISVDNVEALKKLDGVQASVVNFSQSAKFSANCRLMGPIEPADGLSVAQFVSKAFNDEFKMAGIHSDDGTKITGDISNIGFSSVSGLTNGFWDIAVSLKSSNGNELEVANRYKFKSGFDAITACNATADALTPAVQDLIQAAVQNPDFAKLF